MDDLSKGLNNVKSTNTDGQLDNTLANLNEQLTNLSLWWSGDMLMFITTFLIAGALGYAIYTLMANRYAYKKIQKIDLEKNLAFQDFWENRMKPDLVDLLVSLTKELKKILQRYYGIDDDGSLPKDGDEELKEYIRKEILPDDKSYNYKSSIG